MKTLKFDAEQVRKQVEITKLSYTHRAEYGRAPEPGLFLVKDSGIYLMSSGDLRVSKLDGVAYAEGFDPDKDEDVWEACVDAVGGDDFAMLLPLEWFELALASNPKTVSVRFGKKSVSIVLPKR